MRGTIRDVYILTGHMALIQVGNSKTSINSEGRFGLGSGEGDNKEA